MPNIIEINVPYEEILARKERLARARRFERTDRVPVVPSLNTSYLLTVIAETRRVLEKLAGFGGLIVQDGNSIARGSPNA